MREFIQNPILATIKCNQIDTVFCTGDWTLDGIHQLEAQLEEFICSKNISTVMFDGSQIRAMDTAGAWLLYRTYKTLEQAGQTVSLQNFDTEHSDLLKMMSSYAAKTQLKTSIPTISFLENIGKTTYITFNNLINFLVFIGKTFTLVGREILSPSRIRWQAVFFNLYADGLTALPIIGMLAFLTGVVLAYQGGIQLSMYGANIFIVDLVGITLLRELVPLLTAIIIAGRSGSAYTAQIGTMKVTNEIDALSTIGIVPMELLVLPKLLALIILMPLITAYADVVGVFGSMLVAKFSFDVSITDFLHRFPEAVSTTNYVIGIGKTPIFATVIALVGCYQGFQVRGGADQVGKQVTLSVVQAIFLVIIVDAMLSVIFSWLGIGTLPNFM
ncbi:MlaE family lipid ABC transporter permease subunit [Candidatus Halobeggiatoa sp. HSG11]|nr:MlaE family lipid ABC transporter permease subunit [Candidatus Halobeggiatoa sp. HSG11]